jgi:hypothetical protein
VNGSKALRKAAALVVALVLLPIGQPGLAQAEGGDPLGLGQGGLAHVGRDQVLRCAIAFQGRGLVASAGVGRAGPRLDVEYACALRDGVARAGGLDGSVDHASGMAGASAPSGRRVLVSDRRPIRPLGRHQARRETEARPSAWIRRPRRTQPDTAAGRGLACRTPPQRVAGGSAAPEGGGGEELDAAEVNVGDQ